MNKSEFTTMIQAKVYDTQRKLELAEHRVDIERSRLEFYANALTLVDTAIDSELPRVLAGYNRGAYGLDIAICMLKGMRE